MTTAPRIIKKYPNRRLYDTGISSYVTQAYVRQLVQEDEDFRVIDARSGDDVTRGVLLQILVEQEEQEQALLSPQLLRRIIQVRAGPLRDRLGPWLEHSLQALVDPEHPPPDPADPALQAARTATGNP